MIVHVFAHAYVSYIVHFCVYIVLVFVHLHMCVPVSQFKSVSVCMCMFMSFCTVVTGFLSHCTLHTAITHAIISYWNSGGM